MSLLTRNILTRMIVNFVILFSLLFILGSMIDLIVNLEEFDKAASRLSEGGGIFARFYAIVRVGFDFEGPRVFQVYAYFHGLIAIGAMGFTAAQMWKTREFVAIMAAGISLRRVAMPFIVVTLGISFVALLNQEYLLPRVAPLLLRSHGDIGNASATSFFVPFTPDRNNTLLIARSLDPKSGELLEPSFLFRDDEGRMTRRVYADKAAWDETHKGWELEGGESVDIATEDDVGTGDLGGTPDRVSFFETDLSPHLLTLHRYGQFLGMLGMSQLNEMLSSVGTFDRGLLRRHWYSRFATVAANVLVMLIVIPYFVTRDQISLVRQSVQCVGFAITILFGGSLVMMIPMAGIPAIVSVFLPVIILLPIGLIRMTTLQT